jgi:hypothetical protein
MSERQAREEISRREFLAATASSRFSYGAGAAP